MNDIPVLGIHEIAFEVQDLERSIAFYRDVVGLSLLSRGPQQAWFRLGAQRLPLFAQERSGSGQHFAFLIPPERAEDARRALVAHGFPEETMQQDDGLSVYVRDPDGNKIELYGKRTTGASPDGEANSRKVSEWLSSFSLGLQRNCDETHMDDHWRQRCCR